MKVAIIFSDGIKQINFTPENKDEKTALKLITADDNINLAVKNGAFGEERYKPFTIDIQKCAGEYLRTFDNSDSVMLVLTPKQDIKQNEESVKSIDQVAIDFTTNCLLKVNNLVSEDYKIGFKEGIQKYLENNTII